jgi:hypothetical protein
MLILVYLSPESLWDMHDLDYKDLKKMPHLIDVMDGFITKSTVD